MDAYYRTKMNNIYQRDNFEYHVRPSPTAYVNNLERGVKDIIEENNVLHKHIKSIEAAVNLKRGEHQKSIDEKYNTLVEEINRKRAEELIDCDNKYNELLTKMGF